MGFVFNVFFLIALSACSKGTSPTFVDLPETLNAKWNEPIPHEKDVPVVREVYKHRAPFEDGMVMVNGKRVSKMTESAGTIAHELTHGINSYLREQKKNTSGFFVPYRGAIYLKDTRAKRIHVAELVPVELRGIEGNGGRYHEYVQTATGTEPDAGTYFDPTSGKKLWGESDVFYLWDEWNAYLNGGRAYLEAEQTFGTSESDGLTGPVEFLVYALAGLRAISLHDSNYYRGSNYEDAKTTFKFFAEETLKLLEDGKQSSLSPRKAEDYLNRFKFSQTVQAQALRQFAQSELGSDWTFNVLGF